MGTIRRLGIISIVLICVITGLVSAAVSMTGPTTVTRGGVSSGQPYVDGSFDLLVNGNSTTSAPMHLGLIINPQTMTGDICDRPPYLMNNSSGSGDITLGDNAIVFWPQSNTLPFSHFVPNGVEAPSVGCWKVPWGGTHYYGVINTNNTTVSVGTLYPDGGPLSNEFLSTSVKPGNYQFHLQTDNVARSLYANDFADFNVTVTYGQVTLAVDNSSISAGHNVTLSGVNTDSNVTHLWLGGTGIPECGEHLIDLAAPADPKNVSFQPVIPGHGEVGGVYANGSWYYQWTAPCSDGEYSIYASSTDPADVVPRMCNNNGTSCGSAVCGKGGICGLLECPTCGPEYAKVTVNVKVPDFKFALPEIWERCCCEIYPCGSADSSSGMILTGQTGTPNQEIQLLLFGNDFIGQNHYIENSYTSLSDAKGSFSIDIRQVLKGAFDPVTYQNNPTSLCDIDAGDYYLVVIIPGCDGNVPWTYVCNKDLYGYAAYKKILGELDSTDSRYLYLCPSWRYEVHKFTIKDICGSGSVNINATPSEGYAPLNVTFTDVSTFKGNSWNWNFGDGTANVTTQNTQHAYTKPGTYKVQLTVSNATDVKDGIKYIEVKQATDVYAPPQANFTYTPIEFDPMSVQFIDQSSGSTPLTYEWNFGDGNTSTVVAPAHTFSAVGNYTVTLTVTDNYSKGSSATQSITIPVSPAGTPQIAFHADRTTVWYLDINPVRFYDDTVTTWADSWQWDFGDGSTSSLRSPEHKYSTPGRYTVTLRASNVKGEGASVTKKDYINVQNSAPVINATADPITGDFPLKVQFTADATVNGKTVDQSAPLIKEWYWDFGDKGSSAQQNPVNVYEKPGIYTVWVACTLHDGNMSTQQLPNITVKPMPYADFYWEYEEKDSSCCYLVKFTNTSVGTAPMTFQWDFGDGASSTEPNPTHRFKEVRTYNVTLIVTDPTGTSQPAVKQVQVTDGYTTPTPTPTPTPDPGVVNAEFDTTAVKQRTIQFEDKSTGFPNTWQWDLGDGTSSSIKNLFWLLLYSCLFRQQDRRNRRATLPCHGAPRNAVAHNGEL